jgi:hypothetical protein
MTVSPLAQPKHPISVAPTKTPTRQELRLEQRENATSVCVRLPLGALRENLEFQKRQTHLSLSMTDIEIRDLNNKDPAEPAGLQGKRANRTTLTSP